MARDKGNLVAGAVLAAFGMYIISVAVKLPYVSDVGPGPGFFPFWLGIATALFAAALLFSSFMSSAVKGDGPSRSGPLPIRPLAGWVAVMAAIALLGRIGFVLSFILLTVFLIVALDRRSPMLAVGVALGLALAFHLIFVIFLEVSLPKTIWGV
jgi:putative tricarboxylic transport membrane protein